MVFNENNIVDIHTCFWRRNRKSRISGIYKITSISGNIYIGCSKDIENRFSFYKNMDCKYQTRLFRSLSKYGLSEHVFEILKIIDHTDLSHVELRKILNSEEAEYINLYNSFSDYNDYGLNLTKGGDSIELSKESRMKISNSRKGIKMSDELKEKLRLINTGRKHTDEAKELIRQHSLNRSEESRLKISLFHMGNKHNLGKKASDEARKNMSEAQKGRKHTDESKNKMSEVQKGRKHTEDTKMKISKSKKGVKNPTSGEKISIALKGRPAHNKGIPMSEEQKIKISNSNKGRVVTEETRSKISKSNKGRRSSQEQIEKQRLSMIGNTAWNKGKKSSEEAKFNQSISMKKYYERVNQEKLTMIF